MTRCTSDRMSSKLGRHRLSSGIVGLLVAAATAAAPLADTAMPAGG